MTKSPPNLGRLTEHLRKQKDNTDTPPVEKKADEKAIAKKPKATTTILHRRTKKTDESVVEPTKVTTTVQPKEEKSTTIALETSVETQVVISTVESSTTTTEQNVVEDTSKQEQRTTVTIETPIAEKNVATTDETSVASESDVHLGVAGLGKAVISLPTNFKPKKPTVHQLKETAKEEERSEWKRAPVDKFDKFDKFDKSIKGDKEKVGKGKKSGKRAKQKDWSMDIDGVVSPTSTPIRRKKIKAKLPLKRSPKAKAIKRRVMMEDSITVADLAHAMSEKVGTLIKKLLGLGEMSSANDVLDFETASILAAEFEYEVVDTSFQEDEFLLSEEEVEGEIRPPVVTIMGHVDHGKTTLLDTIRNANVAAGEAGGITQHTSAYQVTHKDQLITFIDTPGHAAFTAMRARGAQVTDIVILVVAADDGPMPQTIEALNHARAAGVDIIVAVNKCDKPGVDPDKIKQDMMRYELLAEEYGGDTMFVPVSALKKQGIDKLLESILLVAEMGEFTASPEKHADGFVLEARLEKGKGPVANLLVKNGTLKVGDTVVLGNVWGRIRAMEDYNGKSIKEASPSTPVTVIGLQDIPVAGDDFVVVKGNKEAKSLVDHRQEKAKQQAAQKSAKMTLEDWLKRQGEGEVQKLNLVIKSDVGGTLEAIKASLEQINVPGTEINVLHAAIGAITETDVSLAHTYNGIIIGFNIRPDSKARTLINQHNVEVRTYSVIYEALEEIEKGLKGLLSPELKETSLGLAEIRQVIHVPKIGSIAGCMVLDGKIQRKNKLRLLREGTIIWEGKLASLRRFKDDVREVEKGYECGMNLDGFNDIKVGDQLEFFVLEEEQQS